ncbi:MAG: hypothetical protein ACI9J2_002215 [Saprospiraceae bacterium]|jgi:hypothetical protein
MTDELNNEEFRRRADQYIHLANEQSSEEDHEKVNASMIYGCARYSAFIVASMSDSVEDMQKDKEEAIRYFSEQFKAMLIENLDDHINNYDHYIQQSTQ